MEFQNQSHPSDNNSNSGLNRREFLGGVAACAAGLAAVSALSITSAVEAGQAGGGCCFPKAKVRLIFTHTSPKGPTWPNIGYDYEGRKKELTKKLTEGCPGIEFLPVTAATREEGQKILETDAEIDGYIVYMIGLWTNGLPQLVAETKKPTILIDDLYGGTGEFLITYASLKKRDDLKVTGVASSRFDDVVEAVRCLETLKKLKTAKILAIGDDVGDFSKPIKEQFGTEVISIGYPELDEAYKKADRDEAKKWAKKWIGEAKKVIEPSKEEIERSGAMYLALLSLLEKYKAQAVTINCLGGFYSGRMSAYPCLGFFQLDNDGRVGACERDQRSTLTKLIMSYLVGRPGFISDPVIDTSKNQIIYAHCVAPNKVYGPHGSTNPYYIRSHSEDRKGAVVRSMMPLGEMTTTIQFDPNKRQVIMHQGKTVANVDEDKACRTKLAAEVIGDIDKLFNYWHEWGWHRVTYYGDLKRQVRHIAALSGYKVIEEA